MLEQGALVVVDAALSSKVLVCEVGGDAASWGAHYVAFLDKERLADLFYGASFFAHGGSDGIHAHGAALELLYYGLKNPVIHIVEPVLVNVKGFQSNLGYLYGDSAVALYLSEVSHSSKKKVGDTWCASGAHSDFTGGFGGAFHSEE